MLKRLLVLGLCLLSINVSAFSVTNAWDVNVRQYRSMNLPIRRGESVDLVATYKSGTNLLSLAGVTNAVFRYKPVTTNAYLWGMNGSVHGSDVCFPWNSSNCVTNAVVDYEIALLARNQTILRAFGKIYFDGWDNFDAYAPPPAPNIIDWATLTNHANLESAPFATDLDIATVGLNSTNYTDAREAAILAALAGTATLLRAEIAVARSSAYSAATNYAQAGLALKLDTSAVGSAAYSDSNDFATAAQGALADNSLQNGALGSIDPVAYIIYDSNGNPVLDFNSGLKLSDNFKIEQTPALRTMFLFTSVDGYSKFWGTTNGEIKTWVEADSHWYDFYSTLNLTNAAQLGGLTADLTGQWLLNGTVFSSGDLMDLVGNSFAPKMVLNSDTLALRNYWSWMKLETNGVFFSYEDGGPAPESLLYNQGQLIASNGVLFSGGAPVGAGADDTTWRDRTNDWNLAATALQPTGDGTGLTLGNVTVVAGDTNKVLIAPWYDGGGYGEFNWDTETPTRYVGTISGGTILIRATNGVWRITTLNPNVVYYESVGSSVTSGWNYVSGSYDNPTSTTFADSTTQLTGQETAELAFEAIPATAVISINGETQTLSGASFTIATADPNAITGTVINGTTGTITGKISNHTIQANDPNALTNDYATPVRFASNVVVTAGATLGVGVAYSNAPIGVRVDSAGTCVRLVDPTFAHGMTGVVPTDVFASLETYGIGHGGFIFRGLNDSASAASTPLFFVGINGATTPTAPCIVFRAGKRNSINYQAIAATEPAVGIDNYSTRLATWLGNGFLGLGITPTEKLHVLGNTTIASNLYVSGLMTSGAHIVTGATDTNQVGIIANATQTANDEFAIWSSGKTTKNVYSRGGNFTITGKSTNTGTTVNGNLVVTNSAKAATATIGVLTNNGMVNLNYVDAPVAVIYASGTNYLNPTNGAEQTIICTGNTYISSVPLTAAKASLMGLYVEPAGFDVTWDTNVFNSSYWPTIPSNGMDVVLRKCYGSTMWTLNAPITAWSGTVTNMASSDSTNYMYFVGGMLASNVVVP